MPTVSERGAKLTELAKLTALEGLGVSPAVPAAMPAAMPAAARLGDGDAKRAQEEAPASRSVPATRGIAGSVGLLPGGAPGASGSWTSYTS